MTGPFDPFRCGSLHIANRFVMAPMTRSKSPGGVPNDDVVSYYARRAAAGVGLIVTEGTTIERAGASNDPSVPNFHTPEALAGWRKVIEAVHAAGGKIAPQLWHLGMVRKPGMGPYPEGKSDGPSGLSAKGDLVGEPMSEEDIADTIAAFAKAALSAQDMGFDAVELHGAHGYLIDQFFWEGANRRDDAFGGSLVNRTLFAAEIVRAIRRLVQVDLPIILRFSQWKQQDYAARLAHTPGELEAFLAPLADAGVDIFHCSQRRFWEPEFDGSPLNLAGWTKKLTGRPTITVGSVGLNGADFIKALRRESGAGVADLTQVSERLAAGEFDLIGVGRAILADPEWVAKVRDGRHEALRPFELDALATLR